MKDIVIFTDTGVDDAFALIYALKHPQLNVLAILAGYGNVSKEKATRNVYYLLKKTNNTDIPIISGASKSLAGDRPTFYEEIHGYSGLGEIETEIEKFSVLNFDQFYKILDENENVTLVNLGRLTSLSMSYITAPDIMNKISDIVIMGGAFLVPGNVTPYAEANFYADPTAAKVVINNSSPKTVTLVPLNITEKAILTMDLLNTIVQESVTELGSLLEKLFNPYYEFYQKKNNKVKGAPLHDLTAMIYVTNPSLFKSLFRNVTVVDDSYHSSGLTIADFRNNPTIEKNENNYCRILLQVDEKGLIEEFKKIIIGNV
ncbi:nucleoside hydrolase [Pontibacillus yanchengensis]|uniref:Nucleoside hydrolase n=1 Tax=Pontibacillus yanchengensis Y32 TaxID=1385514 RepID=A0A0A2TQ47_9BACI|nr:nucleoside hydrolase [Pontibacillus yanchengensis]KGP71410.1 nucleoside hydrolase [Pontibacillus yanchengensis Y32]